MEILRLSLATIPRRPFSLEMRKEFKYIFGNPYKKIFQEGGVFSGPFPYSEGFP